MKKYIFLAVLAIFMIIFGLSMFSSGKDVPFGPGATPQTGRVVNPIPTVDVNYGNLADHLARNAVIRDLPKNSKIILKFYNFNSGEREWEKSFVITEKKIYEGTIEDPDLIVGIASSYIEELNSRNFCKVITKSMNNGGMSISIEKSKAKLLWKYKGMKKHMSCIGF